MEVQYNLNNLAFIYAAIKCQDINKIIMDHKNEKYNSSIFNLYSYFYSDECHRFSQISHDYFMIQFNMHLVINQINQINQNNQNNQINQINQINDQ